MVASFFSAGGAERAERMEETCRALFALFFSEWCHTLGGGKKFLFSIIDAKRAKRRTFGDSEHFPLGQVGSCA